MDEKSPLKKGDILPETDKVFRNVLITQRDRRNKNIPAVRCFSLSPHDNNKLSVDWERLTTPEECIARIGASFRMGKEEYKQYNNREVYALDIAFLNSLSEIEHVVYDPVVYSLPEKGKVNNPAHSLVVFLEEFTHKKMKEPETLIKIRDHAVNKKAEVDWSQVEELVQLYRI
ncbi:MAG: hypothetical protein ACOCUL_00150 [Bacteroidota bacterium]